ncbi:MAG: ribose-5-phosphate isomerase RpiA [Actinomycetota bacterium]|nr:ribose-5-phosphate isomerase RpiA [Actinomycetota bacterium]
MSDAPSPAREAAAQAAVELIEPGMTIGLGSGRAVWRVIELIRERWPEEPPLHAVVASDRTQARAMEAGIGLVELDGSVELDLALDGADELDAGLRLIKGGGGALLREKLVVAAARRFVVVAESSKRVERLGEDFRLPVEIVQFAWPDTRHRVAALLPEPELREEDGAPFMTDEGHFILDCPLPADVDVDELDVALGRVPGVVEHGLFIGVTERALLGTPEGGVDVLVAG